MTEPHIAMVQFVAFLKVQSATGHKKWLFTLSTPKRVFPTLSAGLEASLHVRTNPGEVRGINYRSGKDRRHQRSEFQERRGLDDTDIYEIACVKSICLLEIAHPCGRNLFPHPNSNYWVLVRTTSATVCQPRQRPVIQAAVD